jgi:hypothetical protein
MPVCEICSAELTDSGAQDVPTVALYAAVRMGYEPYSGSGDGRSGEQRREDFLLLLAMHDPSWTLCPDCRDEVHSHADKEGDLGIRVPEMIRILGNGFRPEPAQWRVILGAWLDKLACKGIEVALEGTRMEIGECAKVPFEEFLDILIAQKKEFADRLVDELVTQGIQDAFGLVAVWSVKDSRAMTKVP